MENLEKKVVKKTATKTSMPIEKKEIGFVEWLSAKKKLNSLPKGFKADKSKLAEALRELEDIEDQILKQL